MEKKAETAYAIHDLLADRWSPVAFEPRPIPDESLGSLLEAARWAPSCFNDQPWFFLVARRQNEEEYQRMLECLVEGNRAWAQNASVLMITATRTTFRRNQKPNRFAPHDLGLAVGGLLVIALVALFKSQSVLRERSALAAFFFDLAAVLVFATALIYPMNFYLRPFLMEPWGTIVQVLVSLTATFVLAGSLLANEPDGEPGDPM